MCVRGCAWVVGLKANSRPMWTFGWRSSWHIYRGHRAASQPKRWEESLQTSTQAAVARPCVAERTGGQPPAPIKWTQHTLFVAKTKWSERQKHSQRGCRRCRSECVLCRGFRDSGCGPMSCVAGRARSAHPMGQSTIVIACGPVVEHKRLRLDAGWFATRTSNIGS